MWIKLSILSLYWEKTWCEMESIYVYACNKSTKSFHCYIITIKYGAKSWKANNLYPHDLAIVCQLRLTKLLIWLSTQKYL